MGDKTEMKKHEYLHRFNGELYPKNISRRMLATSFAFPICAAQAYIHECYILSALTFLVFLASINYWRSPKRGLRRNIDIVNSIFAVSYHMMYATIALENDGIKYVYLGMGALIPYSISVYARDNGHFNVESFFHCGMHLYGVVVNCLFYREIYHYNQGKLYY